MRYVERDLFRRYPALAPLVVDMAQYADILEENSDYNPQGDKYLEESVRYAALKAGYGDNTTRFLREIVKSDFYHAYEEKYDEWRLLKGERGRRTERYEYDNGAGGVGVGDGSETNIFYDVLRKLKGMEKRRKAKKRMSKNKRISKKQAKRGKTGEKGKSGSVRGFRHGDEKRTVSIPLTSGVRSNVSWGSGSKLRKSTSKRKRH